MLVPLLGTTRRTRTAAAAPSGIKKGVGLQPRSYTPLLMEYLVRVALQDYLMIRSLIPETTFREFLDAYLEAELLRTDHEPHRPA